MVLDARHFEDEGNRDETLKLWGIGPQTMGKDALTIHEDKHALFDEKNHSNFSNDSDEDMEELVDDE